MLRFIFISICLVVLNLWASSQNYSEPRSQRNQENTQDKEETPKKKKEKTPYPDKKRGTELGIDISRFLVPVFDDNRIALAAMIRTNLGKRTFFAGSLGSEQVSFNDKSYTYKSNGAFATVGVDYDIFVVEEQGNNDNILIGLHYGYALQEHGAASITINEGYWGDYTTSVSPFTLSTHWVELVAGLRCEVLNNFYMSWMIHVKGKISSSNAEILEAYKVPGFGTGSNNFNLGFSYVIGYQIPWGNRRMKRQNFSEL